jgi:hypothetical protein
MRKIDTIKPGKIEEIAVVTFFIIFFIFVITAESFGQTNGNSGHCREFNATNTGIAFSKSDPGLASGSAMTVTAWVKSISSTVSNNWAGIVNIDDSSSNGDAGQFWLQHSQLNTQFEFALENVSGNRTYVQSTTTPTDGVWYHVAGVYDGSYIYIYVNGVMEAKTAQTGKINTFASTFKMAIGRWAYSGNTYRRFDGDIDEVTLWNVALTQTQIRNYMCKKLVGTESGLIGYWRMNETSGNMVYDVTSNGRNGVAASATSIVWSGAPIGDASNYTYGGTSVSISQPTNKDSIVASNFSSTPSGVQIYRIDSIPNYTTAPSGYIQVVTTYYFGVFVCDQSGANYKITYYYTGNPSITTPSQASLLTRNDNSVLSWTDLGATLNVTKAYYQKAGQKNRAEYAIGLKSGVLPIHLLNFTADLQGNTVALNWATATEVNNDHFTIERTTDGINYETIATVKGAGNSDFELSYSAIDNNPVTGNAYYRLVQTDYDGTSTNYGPIAISFTPEIKSAFSVQGVYPTAFTTGFNVNMTCEENIDLTANIIDMDGHIVKEETVHGEKGSSQVSFSPAGLSRGMYFLVLTDANGTNKVSERLIKQ